MIRPGFLAVNRRGGGVPPGGDPYWANVVGLWDFDDNTQTVTDRSSAGNDISFSRADSISAGAAKFGVAGLKRAALVSIATLADSGDFSFGSAPFTFDFWFRRTGSEAEGYSISKYNPNGNQRSWRFEPGYAGAKMAFRWSPDGSTQYTLTSNAITDGVYHHIALDRDGSGKLRLYIDGTMVDSETSNTSFFNSSADLRLEAVSGHISKDEIRVTKGVARYASDAGFTPPTTAFPRS